MLKLGQRWLHKPDNSILELIKIYDCKTYGKYCICEFKRLTNKNLYSTFENIETRCLVPFDENETNYYKLLSNQDALEII